MRLNPKPRNLYHRAREVKFYLCRDALLTTRPGCPCRFPSSSTCPVKAFDIRVLAKGWGLGFGVEGFISPCFLVYGLWSMVYALLSRHRGLECVVGNFSVQSRGLESRVKCLRFGFVT